MQRGKYIVIEGIEAVGKSTIIDMLARQLAAAQLPVEVIHESEYQSNAAARSIQQLLQDPHYPINTTAEALLYNAARSQSLETIQQAVANGIICLTDRSYLTSLVTGYYGRGDITDYAAINQIINFAVADIQPDLVVILDAPVDTIAERIRARGTTHPIDESYLERVRAGYLWEAKQRGLPVVYSTDSIDVVFAQVWKYVSEALALRDRQQPETKPQSVAQVLADKPLAKSVANATATAPASPSKTETAPEPAAAKPPATDTVEADAKPDNSDRTFAQLATNSSGLVYGFTTEISPFVLADALRQLNQHGDNLRGLTLKPFEGQVDTASKLAQKYLEQSFVIEKASSRLTERLEQEPQVTTLRQATALTAPDQKDAKGHYPYYIPPALKGKLRSMYIRTLNQLFDTYAQMVVNLTTYIRASSHTPQAERDVTWEALTEVRAREVLRPLLPLAVTGTTTITAHPSVVQGLIANLMRSNPEAQNTAKLILAEARIADPKLLSHLDANGTDTPETSPVPTEAKTTGQLADEFLPAYHTAEAQRITLADHHPRNELDIVAAILYPLSDLPVKTLQSEVLSWPYQRKFDVLMAHLSEHPQESLSGPALAQIRYSFDVLCSYDIFRRFPGSTPKTRQALTPRLGYDTPQLVDEAGLSDTYADCFDLSLELYSALQAGNYPDEAEYAALHGHKVRWDITLTVPQVSELCMHTPANDELKQLIGTMFDKLAEVHPLVGEAILFARQHKRP